MKDLRCKGRRQLATTHSKGMMKRRGLGQWYSPAAMTSARIDRVQGIAALAVTFSDLSSAVLLLTDFGTYTSISLLKEHRRNTVDQLRTQFINFRRAVPKLLQQGTRTFI